MNLHQLLQQREALLRSARLANLAFAFTRLSDYADRAARAGLHGPVTLHAADAEADRFCPALVAHWANQSVVDEHFLDEDVIELEEILMFLEDEGWPVDFTFEFDALSQSYLPALRRELAKAGVMLPSVPSSAEGSARGQSGGETRRPAE